jgi:hypothetical protein
MGTRQCAESLRLVTVQNPMELWCRLFKLTQYSFIYQIGCKQQLCVKHLTFRCIG